MPIRPEFLVRGLDGTPQPPLELIERIRARTDGRIGLFYTKAAWAITEAWKEDDPRRARIQSGEMQPEYAFDICGYLPITCSVDEAPAYIERELRMHSAESFAALRYAVQHWNDVAQPAALEDQVLGAVSNDLDRSNIVTPGSTTPVAISLTPGVGATDQVAAKRAARAAKGKSGDKPASRSA